MEIKNIGRFVHLGAWDKLFLVVLFFVSAPIVLSVSIFSLVSYSKPSSDKDTGQTSSAYVSAQVYSANVADLPSISLELKTADARPEIIKQYLENYNSPLVPYATSIVTAADKYHVDYRLITAIAQQESNLCKKSPPDTFNCWGWGIHSRGTLGFSSYQEGIETVTKGLKEEYLNKGYATTEEIMTKYTPSSNGSWAEGVNKFLEQLI